MQSVCDYNADSLAEIFSPPLSPYIYIHIFLSSVDSEEQRVISFVIFMVSSMFLEFSIHYITRFIANHYYSLLLFFYLHCYYVFIRLSAVNIYVTSIYFHLHFTYIFFLCRRLYFNIYIHLIFFNFIFIGRSFINSY